ncbi:related to CAX4 [Lecanosticta acicola]|uniref:Dolichyldiphosphatase n=1 Tax=Lecanosticta acicola TaxID=111012 RepID=A0AAI9EBI4_9PEZI|nr:related to CAX4 [Lecanosticta acicola]
MDSPPLASLSLTHVRYNPADPLSWISAHLALAPQALVISYVSLIYATREVEILLMFAGQMGCEALNWLLKRYIKEERPTQMLGKGYGMPSSHAQYVGFFSVYLTLFLLFRHDPHNHPNASKSHVPTPLWQRLGLALLSIACAAAVAQSRIYLNYHTPRQVYIGVTAGVVCAIGWFIVTSFARRYEVVDTLLETPPLKWLRFRDLVVNETLEDAGWVRWEMAKQRRTNLINQKRK